MTAQNSDARPEVSRPGVEPSLSAEQVQSLCRSYARLLARHYRPDWEPTDRELDVWGHAFNTCWPQAFRAGRDSA